MTPNPTTHHDTYAAASGDPGYIDGRQGEPPPEVLLAADLARARVRDTYRLMQDTGGVNPQWGERQRAFHDACCDLVRVTEPELLDGGR